MKTKGKKRDWCGLPPDMAGMLMFPVVIVIIGILVGVAVPRLGGKVMMAQIAKTTAGIEAVKLAISAYEEDKGVLPKSLNDLVHTDKPYLDMKMLPRDAWGHEFRYGLEGKSAEIRSGGPDGSFDTEDDIVTKF